MTKTDAETVEALRALEQKVAAGELPMWTEITGAIGLNPDNRHISFYAAYHGSLDAAKALHEAVLPGWNRRITEDDGGKWWVELRHGYATSFDEVVIAPGIDDPARAWLLAILSALISETPKGETP